MGYPINDRNISLAPYILAISGLHNSDVASIPQPANPHPLQPITAPYCLWDIDRLY